MGQQPADQGTNLLSILINIAFGFVGGLMVFVGSGEVIAYGSKLATKLIERSGYGRQMAMFGFATSAAPYIVLAPIAGIVAKQLSSVRSLKDFAYFAGAIIAGFAIAFFGQGNFEIPGSKSSPARDLNPTLRSNCQAERRVFTWLRGRMDCRFPQHAWSTATSQHGDSDLRGRPLLAPRSVDGPFGNASGQRTPGCH